MSADRIAAIRARLEAATKGPWRWEWDNSNEVGYKDVLGTDGLPVARVTGGYGTDDADLVAHAPEDLAWLLGEVAYAVEIAREARAEVSEWLVATGCLTPGHAKERMDKAEARVAAMDAALKDVSEGTYLGLTRVEVEELADNARAPDAGRRYVEIARAADRLLDAIDSNKYHGWLDNETDSAIVALRSALEKP